jgi:hypothetical protein
VHRPAGFHGLENITRPPDDHVLVDVVQDNAKLLNDDLPDPEREIRGQGVRAAVHERIEGVKPGFGARRWAGDGDHGGK